MHRAFFVVILIVLSPLFATAQDEPEAKPKPKKDPLPRKVAFELDTWEARLGLEDRQMRELRYAARAAVAKLKEVTEDEEEAEENPWEEHKVKEGPWTKIKLPRALKAASFTKVADIVLTKEQIGMIAGFKLKSNEEKRAAMSLARAHQKLSILTGAFYLTPDQQTKTLDVLKARAAKRQAMIKAMKGKNEALPQVTPIRKDPAFLKILTDAQRRKLKKKPEAGEEL